MIVDVVIETAPGRAGAVVSRLIASGTLQLHDSWVGDSRIDGTWIAQGETSFDALVSRILALDPDIRAVHRRSVASGR